jgi:hypothetical protein
LEVEGPVSSPFLKFAFLLLCFFKDLQVIITYLFCELGLFVTDEILRYFLLLIPFESFSLFLLYPFSNVLFNVDFGVSGSSVFLMPFRVKSLVLSNNFCWTSFGSN